MKRAPFFLTITAALATAALALPLIGPGLPARAQSPARQRPVSPNSEEPAALSDFTGPAPQGKVTLQDVQIEPLAPIIFPMILGGLEARYSAGVLTLVVPATKTEVWKGSVAQASFKMEVASMGQHTLKSPDGTVLWSDADTTTPNLVIEKAADGQATLLDRSGNTLWTGTLAATTDLFPRPSRERDNSYHLKGAGLDIAWLDGNCVVKDKDGHLLWSGTLAQRPVLVIRDERRLAVVGPNQMSSSAHDLDLSQSYDFHFEAQTGTVSIADAQGTVLGTRPVERLTLTGGTLFGGSRPRTYQVTQQARLDVNGTILLTYRDTEGHVVGKAKRFRDGNHGGGSGPSL